MSRPTSAPGRLARYGFTDAVAGRAAGSARARRARAVGRRDEQQPVDEAAAELLAALAGAADPDLALRQLHRIVEAERRRGRRRRRPPIWSRPCAPTPRLRRRLAAVLGASTALGDHLVANPEPLAGADRPTDRSTRSPRAGRRRPGRPGAGAAGRVPARAAADRGGRPDRRADVEQTMAGCPRWPTPRCAAALRPGARPSGGASAAAGRHRDGQVRRRRAELRLRRGRHLRRRRGRGPGRRARCRGPADADLRAGRLAGGRRAAPRGQPGPAGAHPRQPPGLLPAVGAHLGVPGAAQGPAGGRRPRAGPGVARRLQPLVWQAAERPEAVEDVRAMRRRIIDNVPPKELDREIKRGPGGLRDIEFAVQLLQLVHGRGDETLRSRGHTGRRCGRWSPAATSAAPTARRCCAATASCAASSTGCSCSACGARTPCPTPTPGRGAALARPRARLPGRRRARTPSRRSAPTGSPTPPRCAGCTPSCSTGRCWRRWPGCPAEALRLTPEAASERLEILGFADPAGALRHLEALTGGVSRTAAIQRTLLPVLLGEFADAPEPDRGLLAYRQVSDALGPTPWYPAAAARRGPGGAAAGPGARPVPVRRRPARPRPGGAAAAGRRRRAGARGRAVARGRLHRRRDRHGTSDRTVRGGAGARCRRCGRCAAASCSGSPAPTCSARVPARRWRRPAGRSTSSRSARRSPTSPTPPWPPRCGPPRPRAGAAGHARSPSSAWAGSAGREMSYPSDADVLFVYEPPPGRRRRRRQRRRARRRRGAAPAAVGARARPAAGRRRRPAPGGPAGAAGAQPRRVRALLRPLVAGVGGAGAAAGPVRRRRRRAGRAVRGAGRPGALPGATG